MHIFIDDKKAGFTKDDDNIVQVADRAGIGIPAPCYRAKHKNGCCNACVIEIEGKQAFACSTKPAKGMNITLNRDDLKAVRKKRLEEYRDNPEKGCGCSCGSGSDSNGENCC